MAVAQRNKITVARQLAKTEAQPAAMVSTTMVTAKITGHDRQVIERSLFSAVRPVTGGRTEGGVVPRRVAAPL